MSRILWAIGFHQVPTSSARWSDRLGGTSNRTRRVRLASGRTAMHEVERGRRYENEFADTQPFKGLLANVLDELGRGRASLQHDANDGAGRPDTRAPPRRPDDLGAVAREAGDPKSPRVLAMRGDRRGIAQRHAEDFEEQGSSSASKATRCEFFYRGIHQSLRSLTKGDVVWTCAAAVAPSDSQWHDAFAPPAIRDDTGRYIAEIKEKIARRPMLDQGLESISVHVARHHRGRAGAARASAALSEAAPDARRPADPRAQRRRLRVVRPDRRDRRGAAGRPCGRASRRICATAASRSRSSNGGDQRRRIPLPTRLLASRIGPRSSSFTMPRVLS